MTGLLIFLHALVCVLLAMVILMQAGRGGGLTEGFASAESMFGARTNEFMVRTTIVLMTVFLTTSLSLAYVSAKKEKSIIPANITTKKLPNVTIPVNATAETPKTETQENSTVTPQPSNAIEPATTGSDHSTELPATPESVPAAVDNRVQ